VEDLREKIIRLIRPYTGHREGGPITFERFMEMALYEPGMGYYASPHTGLGRAGDYYTSPHMHPVFGAAIGRQVQEMWHAMGRPEGFDIIEMGAGRGYLCLDMLDYLRGGEFFSRLTYTLVEINPYMAEKQKELLKNFEDKVRWASSPEGLGQVRGCVLSNELLDSFPVHLVEMEDGLKEVYVSFEGNKFVEVLGPPSTAGLAGYLREFSIGLPRGYRTEISLKVRDWLRAVDKVLTEGFILTIDYGYPAAEYYSEERTRGTLLCYKGHTLSEDPYEDIGRKDITAHVNFSALKKWGEESGLKCLGFCPQGTFLVASGIDELIAGLYAGRDDYLFEVAKIKRLILPGTMGETHKVMAQYKGEKVPALSGFSLRDQSRYL